MTRKVAETDTFFGTEVTDPFRWLEDSDSSEVRQWVFEQNEATEIFMAASPNRLRVATRLKELWNYTQESLPQRIGSRRFITRHDPLDEQSVLYVMGEGSPERDTVLIDPNSLSQNGTSALTGWAASRDATLVAYSIAKGGGDWQEIKIRDVQTGEDLPEILYWSKFEEDLPFPSVAWHPDGTGFYYNRLPAPDDTSNVDRYRGSQVYWHRVGTAQEYDRLVFENPEKPEENFVPIVTSDGNSLLLHVWKGLSLRHELVVLPLDGSGDPVRILHEAQARFIFIGNIGEQLIFLTNSGAPLGRIVGIQVDRPNAVDWVELVPEQPDRITQAELFEDLLILVTVHDASHRVLRFDLEGESLESIQLPGNGTVSEITIDPLTRTVLLAFESFLQPRMTLEYDIASREIVIATEAQVPFDFEGFTETQFFVPTKDGKSIPVTLIYPKGLVLDGSHAVLMYGYGGFDVSITPTFNASRLHWLESGGIFAWANLRGGGEYGDAWHEAGMRDRKQTVFDDFAEVAMWLIGNGYTTSNRLSICAESNGGLLTAASMLQRPQLFASVVCSIPVIDMLRYPKFTIGRYWVPEYGDAEADIDQFRTLIAYSPLHNVKAHVDYPPVLVTTGEADDRVVPAHAMKFVATLQAAADAKSRPRLLLSQNEVGHGLGKPRSKILELDCAIYTFVMTSCHVTST